MNIQKDFYCKPGCSVSWGLMLRRTLVLRCIIEPAKFYWTATYAYLQQLFFGKKIFLTTFNIFFTKFML